MKKTILSAAVAIAVSAVVSGNANAALAANATLNFDAGVIVCNAGAGTPPGSCTYGTNVASGSFFSMDGNGNGTVQNAEKVAISQFAALTIGSVQSSGGSHAGLPGTVAGEAPSIDNPWGFFGNTGMHQTTSAITAISDDNAGTVSLDFSGWAVTWNCIPNIPMGGCQGGDPANNGGFSTCDFDQDGVDDFVDSAVATLTCTNDCSENDTYTLTYAAHVPVGDPSKFGGVLYNLTLTGTIGSAVPVPAAAWLFGSGLLGLAGVARRRKAA